MRIISGKAGGITLSVPKGEVRPTTDRVREAVFSILNPLMDRADVLDLFAGSGAFGLEALSRGARDARMVDFSRLSCAAATAARSRGGSVFFCRALVPTTRTPSICDSRGRSTVMPRFPASSIRFTHITT